MMKSETKEYFKVWFWFSKDCGCGICVVILTLPSIPYHASLSQFLSLLHCRNRSVALRVALHCGKDPHLQVTKKEPPSLEGGV